MCVTMGELFPNPKKQENNYHIFVESVDKISNTVVKLIRSDYLLPSWCKLGKYVISYKGGAILSGKFDSYGLADRHINMILIK